MCARCGEIEASKITELFTQFLESFAKAQKTFVFVFKAWIILKAWTSFLKLVFFYSDLKA